LRIRQRSNHAGGRGADSFEEGATIHTIFPSESGQNRVTKLQVLSVPLAPCMAFKHSGHLFGDMADGFWK
jgi:hypothetical protein